MFCKYIVLKRALKYGYVKFVIKLEQLSLLQQDYDDNASSASQSQVYVL